MRSRKRTARLAGALYLAYIAVTIFANVTRDRLVVPGDTAATTERIVASVQLLRFSFVGDILAGVLFLLTAWALYSALFTKLQADEGVNLNQAWADPKSGHGPRESRWPPPTERHSVRAPPVAVPRVGAASPSGHWFCSIGGLYTSGDGVDDASGEPRQRLQQLDFPTIRLAQPDADG